MSSHTPLHPAPDPQFRPLGSGAGLYLERIAIADITEPAEPSHAQSAADPALALLIELLALHAIELRPLGASRGVVSAA